MQAGYIKTANDIKSIVTSGHSYSVPAFGIYGCRDALAAFRDAKRKAKKRGADVSAWKLVYA